MELCDQSASELSGLLRQGKTTSREITESVLRRIDEREATINAFITTNPEAALKQADEADRRFRRGRKIPSLNGIPIAVKDILCTKGIKTTCGSAILSNYVPPYNATAVQKILKSGAVLIGKTNMDEFAMGSSSENSVVISIKCRHTHGALTVLFPSS